jgi:hypothetical protein
MRILLNTAAAVVLVASVTGAAAQTVVLTPDQETTVREYIVQQKRASVALPDLDVDVGVEVPGSVELYPVPAVPQYRYAVINDTPVLVDPATRTVVEVIEEEE